MLLIVILGLAIGSFINALVWRLHENKNFTTERSVCEHCGHKLAPRDLIPLVSWLVLRGKCRYCGNQISVQNPISELLMAAVFAVSYAYWPTILISASDWLQFGLWLAIVAVLIGLLLYDVAWLELPDSLLRALSVIVVLSIGLQLFRADQPTELIKDSVLGLVYGGGIFYVLYQISGGKWIGGGDVKLGFVMGFYVGAAASVIALLIAFYSATIYLIPLMLAKKVTRKSRIPFGPFLILGFYVVGIWSSDISHWLQRLLGI